MLAIQKMEMRQRQPYHVVTNPVIRTKVAQRSRIWPASRGRTSGRDLRLGRQIENEVININLTSGRHTHRPETRCPASTHLLRDQGVSELADSVRWRRHGTSWPKSARWPASMLDKISWRLCTTHVLYTVNDHEWPAGSPTRRTVDMTHPAVTMKHHMTIHKTWYMYDEMWWGISCPVHHGSVATPVIDPTT